AVCAAPIRLARCGELSAGYGRRHSGKNLLIFPLPSASRHLPSSLSDIPQHHGSLLLPVRDLPVFAKQAILLLWRDQTETVPLVKADGPLGGRPGANQQLQLPSGLADEGGQQCGSNTATLIAREHVCMTNQRCITHLLYSHDANQRSRIIPSPKLDTGGDLCQQFGARHVRFMPAIGWNHAFVCSRSFVNDGFHDWNFCLAAWPDHQSSSFGAGRDFLISGHANI